MQNLSGAARTSYIDAHKYELFNDTFQTALLYGVEDYDHLAGLKGLSRSWRNSAATSDRFGIKIIMYEGGTHTLVPENIRDNADVMDFFEQFNYTEEMAEIYRRAFRIWAYGYQFDLFNQFVDVGYPGRFGYWGGMRTYLDHDNPKWLNLRGINDTFKPDWEQRHRDAFVGTLEGWDEEKVYERAANTPTLHSAHSGHSLVDAYIGTGGPQSEGNLIEIARSVFGAEFDPDYDTTPADLGSLAFTKLTIPGAPLIVRWDTQQPDWPRYDTLITTEGGPPGRVNDWGITQTMDYACRFAASMIESGRGDDFILWTIWPTLVLDQQVDNNGWGGWWDFTFREALPYYDQSFQFIADYVTWKMHQLYPNLRPDWRAWVLPGSRFMARVYDDIGNGLFPDENIESIDDLFADDIHPDGYFGYGLAAFVFTLMFQIDLRTVPNAYRQPAYDVYPAVSQELAEYYWRISWEIGQEYNPAGMDGEDQSEPIWKLETFGDPWPDWSLAEGPGVRNDNYYPHNPDAAGGGGEWLVEITAANASEVSFQGSSPLVEDGLLKFREPQVASLVETYIGNSFFAVACLCVRGMSDDGPHNLVGINPQSEQYIGSGLRIFGDGHGGRWPENAVCGFRAAVSGEGEEFLVQGDDQLPDEFVTIVFERDENSATIRWVERDDTATWSGLTPTQYAWLRFVGRDLNEQPSAVDFDLAAFRITDQPLTEQEKLDAIAWAQSFKPAST